MAKNNANGVDEMLDMLYEMIDDAKAIPFSNDCRLDRNGALDLLDSIRTVSYTHLDVYKRQHSPRPVGRVRRCAGDHPPELRLSGGVG